MTRLLNALRWLTLVLNLLTVILNGVALFKALGVPALGLLLLCGCCAHPLAAFLKSRPLPPSGTYPGWGRAAIVNLLLVFTLDGTARDVGAVFGGLLIALVLWPKGPSDRFKRMLKKLTPKVRRFGRPVMGGAA